MSNKRPYKIVFTGPESSGKTTMAELAARRFNTNWLPEYSRTFLAGTNGQYQIKDLVTIASGQHKSEIEFLQENEKQSFVFFDTSLLVIKVWSIYKYGYHNFKIEQLLRKNLPNIYFLCDWQIPWEADPFRENATDRDQLYTFYKEELASLKVPYFELKGSVKNRLLQVDQIINKHFVKK